MKHGTLLLAACLLAAAVTSVTAREFCKNDASDGAQWTMLDTESIPEDINNITLQTFEANFVAGLSEAADALQPDEQWVPCAPEDLDYTVTGCVMPVEGTADYYQLRYNLTCTYGDQQDSASFEAVVRASILGEVLVNITELSLDVASRESTPCLDPHCAKCGPLDAAIDLSNITTPDQVVEAQTCDSCTEGYITDDKGYCTASGGGEGIMVGSGSALSQTPLGAGAAGDDSYCGWGKYISAYDKNGNPVCSRCTRFGCNTDGDCRACNVDEFAPTCQNGQVCWQSCDTGFFADMNGGCRQCSNFIVNCADCRYCVAGQPGCLNNAFCLKCAPGFEKAVGTGRCVATQPCDSYIAGCDTCVDCPADRAGTGQCYGGKLCTGCKKKWTWAGDGTATCKRVANS